MRSSLRYLAVVTLLYFTLPFIHISAALAGIVCMVLPFLLLARNGRKSWCIGYCPRSHYFDLLKRGTPGPSKAAFRPGARLKQGVLTYFCINLFFITASTVMVSLGRIAPMDHVRFLMVMEIPLAMPQLLDLTLPAGLLHLSYRIYSMMFTSLAIGTLLALIYRPRSWCAVCPVNTLSSRMLRDRGDRGQS